jgi:hypothetical protein
VSSNVTRNDQKKSKKSSGNNCGHRPDAPRFFAPPEKHANRPEILRRTQKAIQDYYSKPGTLPLLNAANGSTRQQRSERREACIDLLCCIMHFTDLVTLRVAMPQANGSSMGLTMPYLANLSGLNKRRAERAIHDLKAAGIITVHPICVKLADTTYKGLAAIRTVSQHLFTVLGFGKWLKHERQKATERKLHKSEKKHRKELANIQMAINAAKPKSAAPVARTGTMSSVSDHLANIRSIFKPPPD